MPDRRGTRTQRGYNSQWLRYRAQFLADHPVCAYCKRRGVIREATVVDHIRPHKGDSGLFWDPANHQALCKFHHDSTKQAEENRGYSSEVGSDGWPIDAKHPANRGRGG